MIRALTNMVSSLAMWLLIIAMFLAVLAIGLTALGGLCWLALFIWQHVFMFFGW